MFFGYFIVFLNIVVILYHSISAFFLILIYNLLKSNDFQFGLTLLGIFTTWIVTYLTIRNVNKNTNKQIENQNKISYRPYLKIEKIEEATFNEGAMAYYYANLYEREEENNILCGILISLKNVGNGIITGFKILDISNDFKLLCNGDYLIGFENIDSGCFNSGEEISIEKSGAFIFKIYFNRKNNEPLKRNLLFIYKDIDMNLYGSKIEIIKYSSTSSIVYKVSEFIEYKKKWTDFSNSDEVCKYIKNESFVTIEKGK